VQARPVWNTDSAYGIDGDLFDGDYRRFEIAMRDWPEERKYLVRAKQGWAIPQIDLRIMRPEGEAPCDGETIGEVEVRGPWVGSNYDEEPNQGDK
jgi:fatty-acyl-CoA synthase